MIQNIAALLLTALLHAANGAPACELTWTAYKDELCIKAFTNVEAYDDAKAFCASLADGISEASLVQVKDAEMQEFLANSTYGIFDYIWLGAKYDNESAQFKWENGQPLTYSNWMEGYPKNDTDSDSCIELRPSEIKNSIKIQGKWAHETCRKRNLVMCQKSLSWSLQDAVKEIISLRDKHEQELEEIRAEIANVASTVIPVGSIYVEYFNQYSPQSLWPSMSWQDITNSYAGLFFRAEGSGSANWGVTQAQCAPRITKMHHWQELSSYPSEVTIPTSGWSPYGNAGDNLNPSGDRIRQFEGLSFYTEDCEVRPRNQAIRIWKRTA